MGGMPSGALTVRNLAVDLLSVRNITVPAVSDRYRVRGSVQLRDFEVLSASERQLERIRGAEISLVFQDPLLALNPMRRVYDAYPHRLNADEPFTALDAARVAEPVPIIAPAGRARRVAPRRPAPLR